MNYLSSKRRYSLKMTRRIKTHAVLLKTLAHCTAKQRRALLKTADKGLIDAICECIVNVINGNIKISPTHRRTLSKHKQKLRKLSNRGTSFKERKRLLNQRGGFLIPLLMRLVGPAVGAIATAFTGKK